jgi:glutamate-ammonia-ligase adenylyltransferase
MTSIFHRLSSRFGTSFEEIRSVLDSALATAADPERSLVNFERFAENYNDPVNLRGGPGLFEQLSQNPRALEILVTLFSASQFLTEILLRNPQSLALLTRPEALARRKTIEQFQGEAESAFQAAQSDAEKLDAVRRYQHGELLRIGACDFLGLYDLSAVVSQLSRMAIGLVRASLNLASRQTGISADGFSVLAMGKLGGRELNYSSDIDLLFIIRDDSHNLVPLAQKLIHILTTSTPEGFLYRVDMRLRPWGNDGPLLATFDGYLKYLEKSARLWEKQALLKARPIAGDLALGEALREKIRPHIIHIPADEVRAGVHAMKQRTEQFLREKGRGWGEVKLGEGSIRDVEFVLQSLQLIHERNYPQIRTRATLKGLNRLREARLLTPQEAHTLTDGYIFLRTVEHYLQMMDYRQTYTLPAEPAAINLLARRLGFQAREQFLERYQQHCTAIRQIYSKYIGGMETQTPEPELRAADPDSIRQHIARMDKSYAAAFSAVEIGRHTALAEQLNEELLVRVEAFPLPGNLWKITVVAYDYLGELSLICGLMFVHGLDIREGQIFTYETEQEPQGGKNPAGFTSRRRIRPGRLTKLSASDQSPSPLTNRRKIVDVFTVEALGPNPPDWEAYASDLHALLKMMHIGQRREARSELAKRVGAVFAGMEQVERPLYPIGLTIDNELSERYTVLRLETADTVGFLYEFTNALSLTHTYIARMVVQTSGRRVDDLLYVTDEAGKKILDAEKLRELRTAAVLIKHFTHLLPRSPNPASALLHFREFLAQLFARPGWPDELASLEHPEVLGNLARLLGVSDFLWDDFMRMQYANLFPVVSDRSAIESARSRAHLEQDLASALATGGAWATVLNEFKDREMFRIDMRHILGHIAEFGDFSEELTDLAEVVVNTAYHLTAEELRQIHGTPRRADGSISQMTVLGLGKCGGRELGFASDIELMFVYDGEGQTDGAQPLSASAFHEKVVQHFQEAIRARQEGIFHIDLQLRPYGKAGSLAVSLDSFRRYYAPGGPAWAYERQALVKLRPIAGNPALGAALESLRDEFAYNGAPFDVTAMRAMRERQVRHLVSAGRFNAKYSPGGLVDIEYLIQGLQITHGAGNSSLRRTNIREAMSALNATGILCDEDYTKLHKAHTFLRWLIDSMRMVRGNAKDITVPAYGTEEFAFLARRLRYGNDVERLRDDLAQYQAEVREINGRLLG